MEHSIFMLVALVLLIVFAGFQFQKVLDLFRPEKKEAAEMPKTVVKAEELIVPKTKSVKKGSVKKTTSKKSTVKKATSKKKTSNKK